MTTKSTERALDRHIGGRLRALRSERKLSLEAVAELINVSQQQVSRYELGQNRLSAAQLYYLARGLDVPVAWFFREFEESDEERRSGQVWGVSEHWEPETQTDKQRALLTAWEALPRDTQRERVLAMLEAFTLRAE